MAYLEKEVLHRFYLLSVLFISLPSTKMAAPGKEAAVVTLAFELFYLEKLYLISISCALAPLSNTLSGVE